MNTNTQSDLTQILDEIEERAKASSYWRQFGFQSVADVPVLVKALRRAEEGFAKFAAEWADQDINLTASEALRDITAILNQREKRIKDYGELRAI